MPIRELTESAFNGTISAPMRRLAANEDAPVQIPLRPYITEAIEALGLPTTLDAIELQQVYVGHDQRYTHVVFNDGRPNLFLVLVVDNAAEAVLGHRLLDRSEGEPRPG